MYPVTTGRRSGVPILFFISSYASGSGWADPKESSVSMPMLNASCWRAGTPIFSR
jgi:hypothetical protein